MDTDSFFAELDKDFYKEFPGQWEQESEFFIQHQDYTDILDGKRDSHTRLRQKGEKATHTSIGRDGYRLWEVGRTYTIKAVNSPMRQIKLGAREILGGNCLEKFTISVDSSGIIGRLRLVAIKPGKQSDELVFEAA
jgi:hypothetical protein